MDWIKLIILSIGGLAIFLYGMEMMSKDLNNAAGSKIKEILNSFTKNRFTSFLTGVVSTTLIQSSSAVSVMVVSLVEANLLRFVQTFGILLGAGIGTTITAQIIAFKITDYSLVFIAVGFLLRLIPNRQTLKFIGGAIMGFGLLFYGLHLMSGAMYPLRNYGPFIDVMAQLENPILGIFVGILFTAIIQSSSAFIGIVIVMASQGLVSLEIAIPLLLGSNIGTTATAIIASVQSGIEARRVAVTFFIIKLTGVLIICWWIPTFTDLVKYVSNFSTSEGSPITRQVANAHTLFNVLATIALIPFANSITKLVLRLMPEKKVPKVAPIEMVHLKKKMLNQPDIAISLAKSETVEMAKKVYNMIESGVLPFIDKKEHTLKTIEENEKYVDYYQRKITKYAAKISQQDTSEEIVNDAFKVIYIVSELEEMGDIAYNILLPKALIWLGNDKNFSEEGKAEIARLHENVLDYLKQTTELFVDFNLKSANKLKKENKNVRKLAVEIKFKHFERLSNKVSESIQTSENHMEIVAALKTIHSHTANIIRVLNE